MDLYFYILQILNMPEGPSIRFLANQLKPFEGKIVQDAGGYGPMPTAWLKNKKLLRIESWGKHLLFVFTKGTVRVHLGLFGDILIDEVKKVNRSFYLSFKQGDINGYVVKAAKLEGSPQDHYDWRTDALSEHFSVTHILKLLKDQKSKTIAEVLMNQDVFTGSGNKIRNEVLYRSGIHPHSRVENIPDPALKELIREFKKYSKLFLKDLSTKGVNDSFYIYQQAFAHDGSEVTVEVLKKEKRKIYYSEHRQVLY